MNTQSIINDMAQIMNECCNYYDEAGNRICSKCIDCEEWSKENFCCCSYNKKEATALYDAGYRKFFDVASLIINEFELLLSSKIINIENSSCHCDSIRKSCYKEILICVEGLKEKYLRCDNDFKEINKKDF